MAYIVQVCGPARILDAAAVIIDQVEGQALNLGTDKKVLSTAGQVYPTFTGIMAQKPKFSLTTSAIAQVLAKIGAEGLVLATGFEVFNQLVSDATGKRTAGAVHQRLSITTGLIIPRRLQVSQGQPAKLTFDVIGINAGGLTNPVTVTENIALPTTAGIAEVFTLGPIKINGTSYDGIQDLDIDFGLKDEFLMGSGAVYSQRAHFTNIAPKVTIRSNDAAVLSALSMLGAAQSVTDSVLYLRKMTDNGVRVADVTAQHISFTIDQGLWIPTEKGGSHPAVLGTPFEIEPTYDGVNAPLVMSTATAIV